MAHFAKLDENNNVVNVVSVSNDILIVNGVESEQAGIDFLTELYGYSLSMGTTSHYARNYRRVYLEMV